MPWWPSSAPRCQWPADLSRAAMVSLRAMGWLVFHVCRIVGLLVWTLRRNRKAILVIRTDGVGDALLFEPALRSLAAQVDGSDLHVWAPRPTCELLQAHPYVARRLDVPCGPQAANLTGVGSLRLRARLGFHIGRWRFQLAVYPAHSPEPLGNWLVASVRARQRWLTWGDLENQAAWQRDAAARCATGLLTTLTRGHELARNAHLARQWEQEIEGDLVRLYLPPEATDAARAQVNRWIERTRLLGWSALVGIVPGGSTAANNYPPHRWAEAIRRLWAEQGALCAFLLPPEDRLLLEPIREALGGVPTLSLDTGVSVPTLAAVMARLEGVLSTDTGAAHLAIGMHVPTVVLRGGAHSQRYFPWPDAPHAVTLGNPMPCDGCLGRCSRSEAQCLSGIDPDRIVDAYLSLRRRLAPAKPLAA